MACVVQWFIKSQQQKKQMKKQESLNLPVQTNIMILFRKYGLFFLLALVLVACKSKKVTLSGDEPVEVSDFIEFFPDTKLPFVVAYSTLLRKEDDSLLISRKVFTQFVPDSILTDFFGKTGKPKLYPLAKTNGEETYLFVKAQAGNKRAALVLAFDKDEQFMAAMPILSLDQSSATQQTGTMDGRFTITKSVMRKNKSGSIVEGRDVFVLNSASRNFMLIMTDAPDDKATELVNPIDTLSRKQKYTADYGSGKMTLFSFRDGRRNDRLSFFIHFEKDNGECTGELKGEAIIKSPTVAEYRQGGDPCVLQFKFSSGSVTVKELEGCGSRRGLRCSFNGVYPRKKEVKQKTGKSKSS